MKEAKKNIFIINAILVVALIIMGAGVHAVDTHMFKSPNASMQISESSNTQYN